LRLYHMGATRWLAHPTAARCRGRSKCRFLLFCSSGTPRDLHSFPTRRSSDLIAPGPERAQRGCRRCRRHARRHGAGHGGDARDAGRRGARDRGATCRVALWRRDRAAAVIPASAVRRAARMDGGRVRQSGRPGAQARSHVCGSAGSTAGGCGHAGGLRGSARRRWDLSRRLGFLAPALLAATCLGAQGRPDATLLWGGDAEGGAPFVEADPADASRVRGFDVEVAEAIARGLGRHARFIQVQWSSIDQSVERGDFAVGLSGMEDTPTRRARHAVTVPYFEFRELLAVRPEDRGRFSDLAALRGRRVATLGGTMAYDILLAARDSIGLIPVSY